MEDTRSKGVYQAQVAAYLKSAERRWLSLVIRRSIAERLAEVRLQIENPTERNYEGVEVVLEFAGKQSAFFDEDEVFERLGAPKPPKPWGKKKIYDIDIPAPTQLFEADVIESRPGQTTVRFLPQHVRPKARLALPPLHLALLDPALPIDIKWRLTSTAVDGEQEGEIRYEIADERSEISVGDG